MYGRAHRGRWKSDRGQRGPADALRAGQGTLLYPDTADREGFGYERVRRLLDFVRGEPATDFSGTEAFDTFSDRVQPHSPRAGTRWAGEHGMTFMNFLPSSVVKAEESEDFAEIQPSHIRGLRAHHPTASGPGCPWDSS